jgi:hypothetical protein
MPLPLAAAGVRHGIDLELHQILACASSAIFGTLAVVTAIDGVLRRGKNGIFEAP